MHFIDQTLAVVPSGRPGARDTTPAGATDAYWLLRLGAALCFIGHGAFGFITKAAWLPYFAVVGIPEQWAWRLMPLVGAADVLAGMAVLFAPRGIALVYMTGWGLWTALLRPLSGESVFETLERAGNYGVPFALLLLTMTAVPRDWRSLARPLLRPSADATAMAQRVLRWTTCLLLLGHGALGLLSKEGLVAQYAVIGLPAVTAPVVGWIEVALAAGVALGPPVALLVFVAIWKLATEALFPVSGAPVWEFVERAGSYAAPLALAALLHRDRVAARARGSYGSGMAR